LGERLVSHHRLFISSWHRTGDSSRATVSLDVGIDVLGTRGDIQRHCGAAVIKGDVDLVGIGDDMIVGDYQARRINDEAGAERVDSPRRSASASALNSHCDSGPASKPIRLALVSLTETSSPAKWSMLRFSF
jgi:hypothetical protein